MVPRRNGEMTLIHQWLPDLVRLALAARDQASGADRGAGLPRPRPRRRPRRLGRAAASLRCEGLLKSDPVPLREAVAHYRTVGPAVELPAALEDLAVVLAERGREDEARTALNEAVSLYEGLKARWDIRRADSRLRPYGIRRGVRGRAGRGPHRAGPRSRRPSSGSPPWSPGARPRRTSPAGMFLSRRTVQTHVSHILTKLGAKGRVNIVREALRQGISA